MRRGICANGWAISSASLLTTYLSKRFIASVEGEISDVFAVTPAAKYMSKYKALLSTIRAHASDKLYFGFPQYATECAHELQTAIDSTDTSGRYAPPITEWRK